MGKISDINRISINAQKQIYYQDKPIGKWWGKTLFYYNSKTKELHYENFSLIGLLFHHIFGYKKQFTNHGLKDFLVVQKVNIKQLTKKDVITEKTAFRALRENQGKKAIFERRCSDLNVSEDSIIQLFKDGLDVNATIDKFNTSVLYEACFRGRFQVAKYLVENGADVNTRTSEGAGLVAKTPLQAAIQLEHEKLILLLLEHGADVNSKNYYEDSVLFMAINNLGQENRTSYPYYPGKVEIADPKKIIQELLSRNANVNAIGQRGCTPLYRACEKGDRDVIKWLLEKGASIPSNLIFAGLFQGAERIKFLHEIGADLNAKDSYYQDTPLHTMAKCGNYEIVKLLKELGADLSIKNKDQKTAAEAALANNNQLVTNYLEGLLES